MRVVFPSSSFIVESLSKRKLVMVRGRVLGLGIAPRILPGPSRQTRPLVAASPIAGYGKYSRIQGFCNTTSRLRERPSAPAQDGVNAVHGDARDTLSGHKAFSDIAFAFEYEPILSTLSLSEEIL